MINSSCTRYWPRSEQGKLQMTSCILQMWHSVRKGHPRLPGWSPGIDLCDSLRWWDQPLRFSEPIYGTKYRSAEDMDQEKVPELRNFCFQLLITTDVFVCGLRWVNRSRSAFIDSEFLLIPFQLPSKVFNLFFQVLPACLSFHKRLACFRELLNLGRAMSVRLDCNKNVVKRHIHFSQCEPGAPWARYPSVEWYVGRILVLEVTGFEDLDF